MGMKCIDDSVAKQLSIAGVEQTVHLCKAWKQGRPLLYSGNSNFNATKACVSTRLPEKLVFHVEVRIF